MTTDVDVLKQESLPETELGGKYTLNPSEETLSQLGEFLGHRLRKLKTLREGSDWEKEKRDAFNAYHMIPQSRPLPYPGAANLPCPLQRIGVDSFHANVMSSLFANGNRIKIVPVLIQKDFANTAIKAAKYMNYCMNDEVKFYMPMDDADKKAQMFAVGYLEPTYVKEEIWETVNVKKTERVPDIDPQTGEVKFREKTTTKREKKKKTVFDGVQIHSIPVEAIYTSPFFLTLKDAVKNDVVFKMFELSYATIREGTKSSDERTSKYRKSQVDKISPMIIGKIYKKLSDLEQARADRDGFLLDLYSRDEMVELAEAHCWWDIDNDGIKEEISATFHPATQTVIRVSLSPCWIVEINPRPIDDRFYGEGIPRITETIADEWENFHNTRSNSGQWENTTFGFYRAGGRFNPQQITIQPGHFYPVSDPREVVFAQPPRAGSSYFQEEQMLLNYFERVFALDENIQGVGSRRAKTATETMRVSSKASVRFANPFNRIVSSVNEVLNHVWELNKECAPEEKEFYTMDESGAPLFEKMQKYEYSANLQFGVAVQSVFDQQLVRDTMLLAYRLFIVNPLVQQHPEIMWDFSQKTLDALEINIDLPKPPQAKVLSAFEALELIKSGEPVEPEVGIDVDHHIKIFMRQLNAEDIKDWEPEAVQALVLYIDKAKILKQTLESANLNKSGVFPGMPGQGQKGQPPVTANRNPSQMFNTMKVGEGGKSARQNVKNGQPGVPQGGQNVSQSMDQITGPL